MKPKDMGEGRGGRVEEGEQREKGGKSAESERDGGERDE